MHLVQNMDFIRSTSEKMNLWPVEHFFPPFFSRSVLNQWELCASQSENVRVFATPFTLSNVNRSFIAKRIVIFCFLLWIDMDNSYHTFMPNWIGGISQWDSALTKYQWEAAGLQEFFHHSDIVSCFTFHIQLGTCLEVLQVTCAETF